jgi:hypothetical protein
VNDLPKLLFPAVFLFVTTLLVYSFENQLTEPKARLLDSIVSIKNASKTEAKQAAYKKNSELASRLTDDLNSDSATMAEATMLVKKAQSTNNNLASSRFRIGKVLYSQSFNIYYISLEPCSENRECKVTDDLIVSGNFPKILEAYKKLPLRSHLTVSLDIGVKEPVTEILVSVTR